MNLYEKLKQMHQQEVNSFPLAFAFNDKRSQMVTIRERYFYFR